VDRRRPRRDLGLGEPAHRLAQRVDVLAKREGPHVVLPGDWFHMMLHRLSGAGVACFIRDARLNFFPRGGLLPPPQSGGGRGGGESGCRATVRAPLARAPIPAFPRKRGEGQGTKARYIRLPPLRSGGGLGWG